MMNSTFSSLSFARVVVLLMVSVAALSPDAMAAEEVGSNASSLNAKNSGAAQDIVIFHPAAKLPEKDARGRYSFKVATIADVAQTFADFSRKDVRVPAPLLGPCRAMEWGDSTIEGALGNLTDFVRWESLIKIVPVSPGVVAFELGTEEEIRPGPKTATAEEAERAKAAMSVDHFWEIIAQARRGKKPTADRVAGALPAILGALTIDEIRGFEYQLGQRLVESYRWDLWAVAYIVNGGCSDDGFTYFRCWLITQGRDYFEAAMRDPERAADRATTQADLFASPGGGAYLSVINECEALLYVAMEAHKARTGTVPPLIRDVGAAPLAEPAGKRWEEDRVNELYPRLAKKFQ